MRFEEKPPCVSNTYCCVSGCGSIARKQRDLSFHTFPHSNKSKVKITAGFGKECKMDRRKAWELCIGKKVTTGMKICSLHFKEDDYFFPNIRISKRYLKATAVPSKNLPVRKVNEIPIQHPTKEISSGIDTENTTQEVRTEEVSAGPSQNLPVQQNIVVQSPQINDKESATTAFNDIPSCSKDTKLDTELHEAPSDEEIEAAQALLGSVTSSAIIRKDFNAQVCSGDLQPRFCSLIKNNKQLFTLTGLPNLELLEFLSSSCVKYFPMTQKSKLLNVREKVILTFMKLKTNMSYALLTVLFNCVSTVTCSRYITEMIPILAVLLQPAIHWPDWEEIRKNVPLCFKDFENVRLIMDCTEISVEKPKCLCCKVKLYSHYKSDHTIKFLTGVSPAGLITYASKAYGGRCSDKAIFEQSGLINQLEAFHDEIMVDKGFLIDTICHSHNIKLVRPPFLKNKKQLSNAESRLNVKIARARVHIERTYQRIKYFKILSSKFPWNLITEIDNIFIIACGITNLSTPILADDKF